MYGLVSEPERGVAFARATDFRKFAKFAKIAKFAKFATLTPFGLRVLR